MTFEAVAPDDIRRPLDAVFAPRSVAIIGASERPGSVGLTLTRNLSDGSFKGTVNLVNPNRSMVLARRTYASIAAVPSPVDLAVIATPAATVPQLVAECATAGVGAALIISAGFRECGEAGVALERRLVIEAGAAARRMPIVGPNCLGVAVPSRGLNATFASRSALPGSVAFLSQSGALCTAVLDWSVRENVGFSAFVSVGSMLDVGWGDLLDYFADDPHTKAIAIYMEGIGDARSFLSAAREVALSKPVVVIKTGRTEAAAKAAVSHTGALTSADAVIDAAFDRAGVLRVETISDLFDMVEVLDKQPRPRGPALSIVTNAGGPGVLAVDALLKRGGTLAELSATTIASLDRSLPAHWRRANPIDVLGDADPDRFNVAARAALGDPATDALLVILTPQAMTDPTATARDLASLAARADKPVLASWMGADGVAAGREVLRRAGIATFDFPDEAARAFHYMWRHSENIQALYETVSVPSDVVPRDARQTAERLIATAREQGETLLSEDVSKKLLEMYGIHCVQTLVAVDESEADAIADRIGYPVALKVHSKAVTHKAAVGGVRLNLHDAPAVRQAFREISKAVTTLAGADSFLGVSVQPMVADDGYELIIGSSIDPQFGPVMLFGSGGRFVEITKDQALALPPLNVALARRLVERTNVGRMLASQSAGIDLTQLEQLLVRFSQLVTEQKWIHEIEINPLLASRQGLIALDARVSLFSSDVSESQLPTPAIRPYPAQYTWTTTTRDGQNLLVRPIRPSDEQRIIRFHQTLSDRTVHCRYGGIMNLASRTAHERLIRSCFVDFSRQIALVAVSEAPDADNQSIVAVARLLRQPESNEAEFAIVVADEWQRRGIGAQLIKHLIEVAKAEGLQRITATIYSENQPMLDLCRKLGFIMTRPGSVCDEWTATMALNG